MERILLLNLLQLQLMIHFVILLLQCLKIQLGFFIAIVLINLNESISYLGINLLGKLKKRPIVNHLAITITIGIYILLIIVCLDSC